MLRLYLGDPGVAVNIALCATAILWAFSAPSFAIIPVFVFGWIIYVIQEHLVHRYIFHMRAPKNQFYFNMLYRLHYGHHDQIHNKHLLFTPLWFSIPLGLLNLAVIAVFLPFQLAFISVYGGGVLAYLVFEWLHLISHYNNQNRSQFALDVTRRHARHHYINHEYWFTVSIGGGLVDTALGSSPEFVSRIENARTCGIDPEDSRFVQARKVFPEDRTLAVEFQGDPAGARA